MRRRNFVRSLPLIGLSGIGLPIAGAQSTDATLPKPTVIDRIGTARGSARGVTYDGDNLWVGHDQDKGDEGKLIYELSTDGEFKRSFSFSGEYAEPSVYGLTTLGNSLYAFGDEYKEYEDTATCLYEIAKDGGRKSRIRLDDYATGDNAGLASDGTYLYITKYGSQILKGITTDGNIHKSIPVRYHGYGLCYQDNGFFWSTTPDGIAAYNVDGELVRAFDYPAERGYGLTTDGEYFYMISNNQAEILKLSTDVEYDTPTDESTEGQTTSTKTAGHDTNETSTPLDTDGDGVPDSEDYAPRDPSVQSSNDVESTSEVSTPGFEAIAAVAGIGIYGGYKIWKNGRNHLDNK